MGEKVKNAKKTTVRIANNGEQFVQAVALLVIAGFSFYALRQLNLNNVVEAVVTVALVVIGLRGTFEFVKFLDR